MKVVINPLVVTIEVSTLKSAIEQKLCKFKMNTTELPAFIDRILPALKKTTRCMEYITSRFLLV